MKAITIARKPTQGTVAQTALKYGTGGLAIAACRIGVAPRFNPAAGNTLNGASYNMSVYGMPEDVDGRWTLGRWPANLVLEHLPGCKCLGTVKIKSTPTRSGEVRPGGRAMAPNGEGERPQLPASPVTRPADENGEEEVQAWECVEGCAVLALDNQTGDLHGRGVKTKGKTRRLGGVTYFTDMERDNAPELTRWDVGGASRFFKQVAP